ncbi:unnamed protein product [Rotaria sordida]|uniref:Uncharacterized protein n=1 Tax=Rotaria sordida TaxID=392033 RepID=A0A814K909_9BILA|nr:unnamed protein product [Rotaria sordida]CAF3924367.1 unnamed protein product [Rotaria sordida]
MSSFNELDMDLENVSLASFIPNMLPLDVEKHDFAYLTQLHSPNIFDEYISNIDLNDIPLIDWNFIDIDTNANNLSCLNTPMRLSTPDIFRDIFDDDHSVAATAAAATAVAAPNASIPLTTESDQHTTILQCIEADRNAMNILQIQDLLNIIQKEINDDDDEEEEAVNGNIDNCNTCFNNDDHDDDDDDDNDITLISSNQTSSSMVTSAPYPPVCRIGRVSDHDRPYVQYQNIDRATMVKLCRFNIQPPPPPSTPILLNGPRKSYRLSRRVFAIATYTKLTKERLMKFLKKEFPKDNIQYLCVAQSQSDLNQQSILEIQIVLKKRINKKTLFLDSITNSKCNYQVTKNDVAWNAYIKKTLNFVEFNYFKSSTQRAFRTWPLDPIAQLQIEVRTKRGLADFASQLAAKAVARAEDMKATAAFAMQIAEEAANRLATQQKEASYSLPVMPRKSTRKPRKKIIT